MTQSKYDSGGLDRRGLFRGGAAMLGGLGAGLSPFRALAAQPPQAAALSNQTQRVLRWAGPDPADWVSPRAGTDHNVVVVGGGQSGAGISYQLGRKGIGRVLTIDHAEPGQAGVFRTTARMRKLNTSKTLPGPAGDDVALGLRAWYETLNGTGAFDALDHVPRLVWADYLDWFRQVTGTQVRYRTRLVDIEPAGDLLRLHLESDGAQRIETTRKLVLATGYLGGGGPNVPDFIWALPEHLWAHTASPFPLKPLAGKVVAVLGAGASAFDAAAAALEAGAAEVHLFSRKSFINYTQGQLNGAAPGTSSLYYPGPAGLSYWLPDDVRWRYQLLRERAVTSVTVDELNRAVGSDKFHLHVSSPWSGVAVGSDGKVFVKTPTADYHFDFVIAGTGYRVDVSMLPELGRIHQSISLWGDRYRPAHGEENAVGNYYPYLGAGFEFQPRQGVEATYLRNIHFFNPAGRLSFDAPVSNIAGAAFHPVLADAIARDLFAQDVDATASQRLLAAPPPAPPDRPCTSAPSADHPGTLFRNAGHSPPHG
jgi:FAD-dependent urate hydroxylase